MQLSKRLQMSADFVTPGGVVADVGCDHAYLSIYLMEQGIARRVIAMDVNKGPLTRARENIAKFGYEGQIETRLSDGIEALAAGEADTILCAGMGGKLIIHMLSANMEASMTTNEWILQPQSDFFEVRKYIWDKGFAIADEKMCEEDGKFYTSIHAVRKEPAGEEHRAQASDEPLKGTVPGAAGFILGEQLIRRKDPVLREYLKREEELNKRIQKSLEGQETENARRRREEVTEWLGVVELVRQLMDGKARNEEESEL